ncbi:hypothetical protein CR513_52406, partial [Mucuna pruriens]
MKAMLATPHPHKTDAREESQWPVYLVSKVVQGLERSRLGVNHHIKKTSPILLELTHQPGLAKAEFGQKDGMVEIPTLCGPHQSTSLGQLHNRVGLGQPQQQQWWREWFLSVDDGMSNQKGIGASVILEGLGRVLIEGLGRVLIE